MEIILSVPTETIVRMLTSFIESRDPVTLGWSRGVAMVDEALNATLTTPWYVCQKLYERPDLVLTVLEKTERRLVTHFVTLESFRRGLVAMARVSPRHFGMVVAGEIDGPTADVFLQCAVFGKLKYA